MFQGLLDDGDPRVRRVAPSALRACDAAVTAMG
ncbi:hypothetical protein Amir_4314 [Actinosynnema mirum DSM 43827]|uniref:HEAT repeat domain-containing protein n=1 Tax=Actinosynnema mirum (strain ATCC 29888 / DSM 43827 / JCM 3225 / NBRC 14064 / NCIMB 13271 / NRRL B-12336 / IMRU 3971 / 101) TaxID=446462 RepID=C6WIS7_ACTMD|nr:hypothetical protein Amir_4314 [Actinosynnema mirum DSM 43827]